MQIDVSIIVDVANEHDYILDALEQINAQDFKNYEVYIVNAGSSDETRNIIKKYIKNKDKFKLKVLAKMDAFKAKNIALEHITGEYVIFWDTQIMYGHNAVSTLYNKVKADKSDMVTSSIDGRYFDCPLLDRYCNIHTQMSSIKKDSCSVLFDLMLGNKLLKTGLIKSFELTFGEAMAVADQIFMYSYYTKCNNISILNQNILNAIKTNYTTKLNPLKYISPTYLNEVISGYATIIDIASDVTMENNFSSEEKTIYIQAVYRQRYFSLYRLIVKYYWTLEQQSVLMLKSELQRAKNHFNTIEWLELQTLFSDIPLDFFPNTVAGLGIYREIIIALFGEYEGDITSVVDTIKSFYGSSFLRFHIVVPRYVYNKLPKVYKNCKNITAINDYGKNSFYNKVLSTCKSEYIMFTSSDYLYDGALLPLHNEIKERNFDVITTPIYVLDEFKDGINILEYSKKAFVDYESNNYDVNTDEAYDGILANKLISTEYLRAINMTFDGYDFSSCNSILKNACIKRVDTKTVLLKDKQCEDKKFKVVDLPRVRITEAKISKKVVMFALNGKDFVKNLSLLRDELINQDRGIYVEFFFKKLSDTDTAYNNAIIGELKEICKDANLVITSHDFDVSRLQLKKDQDFAIILSPHHSVESNISAYVFAQRDRLLPGVENNDETIIYNYEQHKEESSVEYITYGTPEMEYLLNQSNIRRIKDKFNLFYPHSVDKKIIVISTEISAMDIFDGVDFLTLRNKLLGNYFIVVKAPDINEYLEGVGGNLSNFVIPSPKWLNSVYQVMVADVLVTTKMLQAYYFAPYNKYLYLYTGKFNKIKVSDKDMKVFNASEIYDFSLLPSLLKSQIDSIGGARKATSKIATKLLGN